MNTLAEQLSTLKQAHLRTRAFAQKRLAKIGLTPSRFELLRTLELEGGSCAQHDLKGKLGVTAPSVSRLLIEIAKLELVACRPAERNSRRNVIELTRKGALLVRRGAAALQSIEVLHTR